MGCSSLGINGVEYLTIEQLLHKPFDKHIAGFEIPDDIKDLLDVDMINAVITWYLKWKIIEHPNNQHTCMIKELFNDDWYLVVMSINLYKYLRNKTYDPNVINSLLR